jgi:hypothetical protein
MTNQMVERPSSAWSTLLLAAGQDVQHALPQRRGVDAEDLGDRVRERVRRRRSTAVITRSSSRRLRDR